LKVFTNVSSSGENSRRLARLRSGHRSQGVKLPFGRPFPTIMGAHSPVQGGRLRRKTKEARPYASKDEFSRPMSFLNAVIFNS
jgi:hypothetical protein